MAHCGSYVEEGRGSSRFSGSTIPVEDNSVRACHLILLQFIVLEGVRRTIFNLHVITLHCLLVTVKNL